MYIAGFEWESEIKSCKALCTDYCSDLEDENKEIPCWAILTNYKISFPIITHILLKCTFNDYMTNINWVPLWRQLNKQFYDTNYKVENTILCDKLEFPNFLRSVLYLDFLCMCNLLEGGGQFMECMSYFVETAVLGNCQIACPNESKVYQSRQLDAMCKVWKHISKSCQSITGNEHCYDIVKLTFQM